MVKASPRLISYIAPGAPATRRPAEGGEAFLRPEIGFTPSWYRHCLSINFGERFHNDPTYRRDCAVSMRRELRRRFPDLSIGDRGTCDSPPDLLTGTYGACTVAAIYGIPILYAENGWPTSARQYLNDRELAVLEPPDLDRNPYFTRLMEQVEWIETREGQAAGTGNTRFESTAACSPSWRKKSASKQVFDSVIMKPRSKFSCEAARFGHDTPCPCNS